MPIETTSHFRATSYGFSLLIFLECEEAIIYFSSCNLHSYG
jgi:hypothetical protein